MNKFARLSLTAGAAVGAAAWAAPIAASAQDAGPRPTGGAAVVYVQTDNVAGNQVVAYDRAADGSLSPAATYDTGGLGGVLAGSAVDHTASQGALAYDREAGLLLAVNAGSDTVSVFSADHDRLALDQVVGSGGRFPVSIAVHDNLVYVLDAQGGGSIQGYVVAGRRLVPLPGSARNLGLTIPTDRTQFVNTPGQVAFTPDGSRLVVTTKANGHDIDIFGVAPDGRPSAAPVVNPEPGTVPFGVSFDAAGHLVAVEAATSSLATFTINSDSTLTALSTVATGQRAACWVAPAGGYFYTSNAGSATVSGFSESAANGQLALLGATPSGAGTVDASASPDGRFLYVQGGAAGTVSSYSVNADGSLTAVGQPVTVPGAAGGEGIVAL